MPAVRAAFGLKGCLKLHHRSSEAAQHVFDYMIGPYPKRVTADLSRHVPVAEMPRESHELRGVCMTDVDDRLGRRSNDQPPSIVELNAVAIAHRDRGWKIQKQFVAFVGNEADAPPMPTVEIERNRTGGKRLGPLARTPMNDRPRLHSLHVNRGSSAAPLEPLTPVYK